VAAATKPFPLLQPVATSAIASAPATVIDLDCSIMSVVLPRESFRCDAGFMVGGSAARRYR